MDQIPILDQIPEKWRPWLILALYLWHCLGPDVGRAWRAWKEGGGLNGIWRAIMFGTQPPSNPKSPDVP